MAFIYTNRKDQVYYLHTGKTKSGRPHWFMSTKSAGLLADAIPEGYELWESPEDAQVFVRKLPPRIVTKAEVELVQNIARTKAQTHHTIVDAKGKSIIVYAADDDLGFRGELMSALGDPDPTRTRRFMERSLQYVAMLRFELIDPKARTFFAYRWCFLGSIDDWFPLESGPLATVAKEYLPHLGAESFFELM